MFVKPGPNSEGPNGQHVVRVPRTRETFPAEGREVPDNDTFWLRRLRAGDVVLVTHTVDGPEPATEEKPA